MLKGFPSGSGRAVNRFDHKTRFCIWRRRRLKCKCFCSSDGLSQREHRAGEQQRSPTGIPAIQHVHKCVCHRTGTRTPHALCFMYVPSIDVCVFNECNACGTIHRYAGITTETCDLRLHNIYYDNVKLFYVQRMQLVKNEHGFATLFTSRILNTNKCL